MSMVVFSCNCRQSHVLFVFFAVSGSSEVSSAASELIESNYGLIVVIHTGVGEIGKTGKKSLH